MGTSQDDELGLGGAYAGLERGAGHESFIELTWKKPLGDHFYIQPDLHYVITPSGKNSGLKNALVGNIRFGIEL